MTAKPETVSSLADYLAILHHWTEKIQSSPAAIERSVYEIIGKEFRSSGVSLIELRFNPMKRNLGGERDLDHIIHAALRGMDRACLEYGVRAGLIFCLAREFPVELNEILVKKAVKYQSRGVVGIDLAGPEAHTLELGDEVDALPRPVRARARRGAGHHRPHRRDASHRRRPACWRCSRSWPRRASGTASPRPTARRRCASWPSPARCWRSAPARTCARTRSPTCEELGTGAPALRATRGVRYTINTDGPYLLNTHLRHEYQLLIEGNILSDAEAERSVEVARAASFIK